MLTTFDLKTLKPSKYIIYNNLDIIIDLFSIKCFQLYCILHNFENDWGAEKTLGLLTLCRGRNYTHTKNIDNQHDKFPAVVWRVLIRI